MKRICILALLTTALMAAADSATARGLSPLIYHSRFKYGDRVQRHKDVVQAFTPKIFAHTKWPSSCTKMSTEQSRAK